MFKLSPDSALQLPLYRRWLLAQFAFHCSSWLMYMSEAWLAYELTKSATLVGALSLLGVGPVLFLSAYGGSLADRYDGAGLVKWLHWAAFGQALLTAVLYFAGALPIEALLAMVLLRGCIGAVNAPVRQANAIRLLPDKKFVASVQALTSVSQNLSRLVGPCAAAAIIALSGQAASFVVSALLCLPFVWVASMLPSRIEAAKAHASSMRESFQFIWGNPKVASLVLLIAANCFLLMPYSTVFTAYAQEVVSGGVGLAGLLTGIGAPAAILVSLMQRRLLAKLTPLRLAQISLAVGAVSEMALGAVASIPLALATSAILAATSVCASVAASTYVQLKVEDRMRGKVTSLVLMCNLGVAPFGALLMGAVASHYGVLPMYRGFGLVLLVFVLGSFLRSRKSTLLAA